VTNANPALNPERLTGFEGGVLYVRGMMSARVAAFWNQLDDAITNVTINTTPALITRQRQNTDTVRASGFEFEAEYQPRPYWTVSALFVATRSIFSSAPEQPDIEGNSVPQVPIVNVGGSVTYAGPQGFTGAMQVRAVGRQFDDDLNVFELETFGVVDLTASQEVRRGVSIYAAFENLFDTDYDVGKTPLRTLGYPRTFRMGARVFLP
jgi:outer membrane receptor protein involved in Fe transport